VLLFLLPIKAANTLVMHNREQIASELTYLQDQKSLPSIASHIQHGAVTVSLFVLPIMAAIRLL
jgi:pyridoxine 5'-phosphate synthase PdxJ